MALLKQALFLPFRAGVNTKADPLQVAPPGLLRLENATFQRPGRVSTRFGYKALSTDIAGLSNGSLGPQPTIVESLSAAQAVASYGGELVTFDGEVLWTYDPATAAGQVGVGASLSPVLTQRPVYKGGYNVISCDGETDVASGLECYAYHLGNAPGDPVNSSLNFSVVNSATGTTVAAGPLALLYGAKPKVLAVGGVFWIVWVSTQPGEEVLLAATIPTANPSQGATIVPITATGSGDSSIDTLNPNFDACTLNGSVYLAFASDAGDVRLWQFTAANWFQPAAITPAGFVGRAAVVTTFIDYSATAVVVAAWEQADTDLTVFEFTPDLSSGLGTASLPTPNIPAGQTLVSLTGCSKGAIGSGPSLLAFFWTVTAPYGYLQAANYWIGYGFLENLSPIFSPPDPFRSVGLTGKAFLTDGGNMAGGNAAVPVEHESPLQPSGFILSDLLTIDASVLADTAGPLPKGGSVVDLSGGIVAGNTFTLNGVAYEAVASSPSGHEFLITTSGDAGENAVANARSLAARLAANDIASYCPPQSPRVFVQQTITAWSATGAFVLSPYGAAPLAEVTITGAVNANSARIAAASSSPQSAYNAFRVALLQQDLLTTLPGTTVAGSPIPNAEYTQAGVTAATINYFDPIRSWSKAVLGNTLLTGGATPRQYDGLSTSELGFMLWPEIDPTAGVLTTTGGHLGTGNSLPGQYQWCFTYSWTDAHGQVQQSAPSVPIQFTTAANNSTSKFVTPVPTLRVTEHGAVYPVTIQAWRTIANGTIFYSANRVETPALASAGGTNQPIFNDKTADFVTFTDVLSDADLQGNAQLYTTGGRLENIHAPCFASMTVHFNRVFGLPSDNPFSIWYSQQCVPGQPVEFNDLLVLNLDPQGGAATAVAGMDEKLIVFKESSIFYVTGQGPNPTGSAASNDFTPLLPVTTDAGCIGPRSVTLVPQGLVFQSAKGIYLLGRDLSVTYIGAPVEQLVQGQTITSSQLLEDRNIIRFTLASGSFLNFDYYVSQWSRDTGAALNAADSCLFSGVFTFCTADGQLFSETVGAFVDPGGLPISMGLTTGWITLTTLQGYQRMWRAFILGAYQSPHSLRVRFAYNYNPAWTQEEIILPDGPFTWGGAPGDPSNAWGGITGQPGNVWGGDGQPYQWKLFPKTQKAQSMQLCIDVLPSNSAPGEAVSLSGLTLIIGAMTGGYRTGANRSPTHG